MFPLYKNSYILRGHGMSHQQTGGRGGKQWKTFANTDELHLKSIYQCYVFF